MGDPLAGEEPAKLAGQAYEVESAANGPAPAPGGKSGPAGEAASPEEVVPSSLLPFAARLFNRFPAIMMALGHPSLSLEYDLPPERGSFGLLEDTAQYKLIQVVLRRRTLPSKPRPAGGGRERAAQGGRSQSSAQARRMAAEKDSTAFEATCQDLAARATLDFVDPRRHESLANRETPANHAGARGQPLSDNFPSFNGSGNFASGGAYNTARFGSGGSLSEARFPSTGSLSDVHLGDVHQAEPRGHGLGRRRSGSPTQLVGTGPLNDVFTSTGTIHDALPVSGIHVSGAPRADSKFTRSLARARRNHSGSLNNRLASATGAPIGLAQALLCGSDGSVASRASVDSWHGSGSIRNSSNSGGSAQGRDRSTFCEERQHADAGAPAKGGGAQAGTRLRGMFSEVAWEPRDHRAQDAHWQVVSQQGLQGQPAHWDQVSQQGQRIAAHWDVDVERREVQDEWSNDSPGEESPGSRIQSVAQQPGRGRSQASTLPDQSWERRPPQPVQAEDPEEWSQSPKIRRAPLPGGQPSGGLGSVKEGYEPASPRVHTSSHHPWGKAATAS